MNTTKSQAAAIRYLQTGFIARTINHIENIRLTFTDYGVIWAQLTINRDGVQPGTVAHSLFEEYWFIRIGKRGGMEAVMYPQSCDQFAGKRAFNMKFRAK